MLQIQLLNPRLIFNTEIQPRIILQVQIFPRLYDIADLSDVVGEMLYNMHEYADAIFFEALYGIRFQEICIAEAIQYLFDVGLQTIE